LSTIVWLPLTEEEAENVRNLMAPGSEVDEDVIDRVYNRLVRNMEEVNRGRP